MMLISPMRTSRVLSYTCMNQSHQAHVFLFNLVFRAGLVLWSSCGPKQVCDTFHITLHQVSSARDQCCHIQSTSNNETSCSVITTVKHVQKYACYFMLCVRYSTQDSKTFQKKKGNTLKTNSTNQTKLQQHVCISCASGAQCA